MNTLSVPDSFVKLCHMATLSVGESSRRIYQDTYKSWAQWTEYNGLEAFELNPIHIEGFLLEYKSANTRKRALSAMRKLVNLAAIVDERYKLAVEVLKDMRIPMTGLEESRRTKKALSPAEVERVLAVWDGGDLLSIRNKALIAVLLATWVRRAEAASIRWEDINFDDQTLVIRHGKGDKRREVAIVGDYAIPALLAWFDTLHRRLGAAYLRTYVFCGVESNGIVGSDVPLLGNSVGKVVTRTSSLSGVSFRAHDLRRSGVTEAIRLGSNLKDVQAQAGHVKSETTMLYVEAVSAAERVNTLKSRFGH